jgi:phospholipid transport system substrate-binding protein
MFNHLARALGATMIAIGSLAGASAAHAQAQAQTQTQTGSDALVRQISVDVIDAARADKAIQAGDTSRILALVDAKVMPHIDFDVVTGSAVGPMWRDATPEQLSKLQAEFKTLLVRVYGGALAQVRDQSVAVLKTVPVPGGTQVVVQTEIRGAGDRFRLDYRVAETGGAWKIIDVGISGIWLVQSYRSQFAAELNKGGVDGLIAALAQRNKS